MFYPYYLILYLTYFFKVQYFLFIFQLLFSASYGAATVLVPNNSPRGPTGRKFNRRSSGSDLTELSVGALGTNSHSTLGNGINLDGSPKINIETGSRKKRLERKDHATQRHLKRSLTENKQYGRKVRAPKMRSKGTEDLIKELISPDLLQLLNVDYPDEIERVVSGARFATAKNSNPGNNQEVFFTGLQKRLDQISPSNIQVLKETLRGLQSTPKMFMLHLSFCDILTTEATARGL